MKTRKALNEQSEIPLGQWWIIMLRFVTPAVLTTILIINLKTEWQNSYENYPRWATLIGGWGTLAIWVVLGYILWKAPAKKET